MTRDSHHHGNLRAALIAAGMDLLREGGIAALTLRRAAARAGVSHAAPAHHFGGLDGLLTAIAAAAFARFTDRMCRARDAAPADDFSRLLGVTQGYLDFSRDHAGLFQLMFTTPGIDRCDSDLMRESHAAYDVLRQACAPFTAGKPPETVEVAVWSLVHGYALLGLSAPDAALPEGVAAPAFGDLLAQTLGV